MRLGDEAIHGDGRVSEHVLYDHREVKGYNPFEIPENMPMMNPVSWELMGEWEDGWHISAGSVIKIENKVVIESYSLTKLEKGTDMLVNIR